MDASGNDITAAVNRFGLGGKPGELEGVREPREWLNAQIVRGADDGTAFSELPGSLEYLREAARLLAVRRDFKRGDRGRRDFMLGGRPTASTDARTRATELKRALKPYRAEERRQLLAEAATRHRVATTTDTPFVERLVRFWSNHFAVSVDKRPARLFAGPMEREAIRPHVAGRFADMLLAVETHPAMLLYLDNVRSVGPNSPLGRRIAMRLARRGDAEQGKAGGLNENLGREAMELHTVGVDAGYTQADVTEFSRALTGWSIPFPRDFDNGRQPQSAFVFRANAHEPGSRRVMGRTFADDGFEQGKAILAFLARQPATARHLSLKLARHFVSDDPPRSLVDRMAKSYLRHDTDLAEVYRTLIASPEAWEPGVRKFKTPQDFVISAARAGQIDAGDSLGQVLTLLKNLGEPTFDPRSPAGFSDTAADWIDAGGLWKRVQAAEALSARAAQASASSLAFARDILGPSLDADTAQAIRRAESPRQALATLFACPAFQWRV